MSKLSDEEKKAIELLKKLQKKTPYIIWGDGTPYNKSNQIQTVLNLIENQQKEIERLEARKYMYNAETGEITQIPLNNNYISKGKIRAKIEELEKEQENNRKSLYNAINILYFKEIDKISNRICVNMTTRDILQSLLEEE